ncbi:uncharacterized protein LOC127787675 [Diospyros lotus]|uniref:uncharacterized protein LOC127787675 n=1 Tax=Diospyros lotus TaxID=55363 RepID=UPI0022501B20|nr:uncharacterized protein LOC127787675 [Diospyros lotus]
MELTAFDIEYKPRPAIKAQSLANFIAERIGIPKEAEENQKPWTVAVDGSSTSSGRGAGLMVKSPEGEIWPYALHFEFRVSNNEAEYEALLAGLRLAEQLGAQRVELSSDSNLVVQQVEYVPWTMNAEADLLSRIASSSFPTSSREIRIESLPQKSIEEVDDQLCVEDEPSWMDPFLLYLKEEKLPKDDSEAREPLLKCIRPREADYILREIHEGICGSHIGARTLSQKALRQGYYWPTMVKDSEQLVRTCDRCQRTSNLVHIPAVALAHLATPCSFAQWGIDILGPFPPVAGQVKYIIAVIDYFTKWVEAEAVAFITARRVKKFLWKNVVSRFGIPRVLISNNGTQFTDRSVQEWCQALGIRQ